MVVVEEVLLSLEMATCLAAKLELLIRACHDLWTHLNRMRDFGGSLERICTFISCGNLESSSIFNLILISNLFFRHFNEHSLTKSYEIDLSDATILHCLRNQTKLK